jgi:hypothetical protein
MIPTDGTVHLARLKRSDLRGRGDSFRIACFDEDECSSILATFGVHRPRVERFAPHEILWLLTVVPGMVFDDASEVWQLSVYAQTRYDQGWRPKYRHPVVLDVGTEVQISPHLETLPAFIRCPACRKVNVVTPALIASIAERRPYRCLLVPVLREDGTQATENGFPLWKEIRITDS